MDVMKKKKQQNNNNKCCKKILLSINKIYCKFRLVKLIINRLMKFLLNLIKNFIIIIKNNKVQKMNKFKLIKLIVWLNQ